MDIKQKLIERLNLRVETLLAREENLLLENAQLQDRFNKIISSKTNQAQPSFSQKHLLQQLDQLTRCNSQLQAKTINFLKHQQDYKADLASASEKQNELKSKVDKLKDQLKHYKAEKGVGRLEEEAQRLKASNEQLEQGNRQLQQKLQESLVEFRNESDRYRAVISGVEKELADERNSNIKHREEIKELIRFNREVQELLASKQELDQEKAIQWSRSQTEFRQQISTINHNYHQLQQTNKQLEQDIQSLQQTIIEKDFTLKEQQQLTIHLQQQLKAQHERQSVKLPQFSFTAKDPPTTLHEIIGQLPPYFAQPLEKAIKFQKKELRKTLKLSKQELQDLRGTGKQYQNEKVMLAEELRTVKNALQKSKEQASRAQFEHRKQSAKVKKQCEELTGQKEKEVTQLREQICQLGKSLCLKYKEFAEQLKLSEIKLDIFKDKVGLEVKARISQALERLVQAKSSQSVAAQLAISKIEGLLSNLIQVVDTIAHKEAVINQKAQRQKKLKKEIEKLTYRSKEQENDDRKRNRKECAQCIDKNRTLAILGAQHAHCTSVRIDLQLKLKNCQEKSKIRHEEHDKLGAEALILCRRVEQKDRMIELLESQLKDQAKKHKLEVERMSQAMSQAKSKLAQIRAEGKRSDSPSKKEQLTMVRNELRAKKEIVQALRNQNKEKQALLETAKEKEEALSAQNQRLRKNDRQSARTTITSQQYKGQLERLKEESHQLREKETNLTTQNKKLVQSLSQKEQTIKDYRQRIKSLEGQLQSNHIEDKPRQNEMVKSLKADNERKDQVIKMLKKKHEVAVKQVENIQAQFRDKELEAKGLNVRVEEMKKQVRKREEKIVGLLWVIKRVQGWGKQLDRSKIKCESVDRIGQGLQILNITAQQLGMLGKDEKEQKREKEWEYKRVLQRAVSWQEMYNSVICYLE